MQNIEIIVERVIPSCASDGGIDISVDNVKFPRTYSWSNGTYGQDNYGIGNGLYTVTVTDPSGCSAVSEIEVETTMEITLY